MAPTSIPGARGRYGPKIPVSTSTVWYACYRGATGDRHQGRYSGPMEGARHRADVIDSSVGLHLPGLNEPRSLGLSTIV
jgi:hypothetical protein